MDPRDFVYGQGDGDFEPEPTRVEADHALMEAVAAGDTTVEIPELLLYWDPAKHGPYVMRQDGKAYRGTDGRWRWGDGVMLNRAARRRLGIS